jgi:hypothetical protein
LRGHDARHQAEAHYAGVTREAAKIEARRLIAQIASGRQEEELLSISEAEDYRLAKQKVAPFGVSLLGAIEEWVTATCASAMT